MFEMQFQNTLLFCHVEVQCMQRAYFCGKACIRLFLFISHYICMSMMYKVIVVS